MSTRACSHMSDTAHIIISCHIWRAISIQLCSDLGAKYLPDTFNPNIGGSRGKMIKLNLQAYRICFFPKIQPGNFFVIESHACYLLEGAG